MVNCESRAKSAKVQELVNNLVGKLWLSDGQFAYNIGTQGRRNDEFDASVVTEVGQWMKRHPDAITDTAPLASPAPARQRSRPPRD